MAEEYSREELWKLYEVLPNELKEAIFSVETANSIYETCTRNGLKEEEIPEIAKYTGYVLMGLLPPNEFEKTLKEKVGLDEEKAKKVSQEIDRFVFFPLRTTLETIYKEIGVVTEISSPEKTLTTQELEEKKVAKTPKRDIYREPIE